MSIPHWRRNSEIVQVTQSDCHLETSRRWAAFLVKSNGHSDALQQSPWVTI